MSTATNEPRALTAALSQPAFVTKAGGLAMRAANRHVARWAPEVGEIGERGGLRHHPLRNLAFVDRLVAPWLEPAQRSPALRLLDGGASSVVAERPPASVSWVFPRPWYQDELDWMAASRAAPDQGERGAAAPMFTTRGTFVAPAPQAVPSVLHEYIAPSLSITRPGAPTVGEAFSPLVPLAATQVAQLVARTVAPIVAGAQGQAAAARISPGLRAVLSGMLARSASADEPTRASTLAPELVTPPAPRAEPSPGADGIEATQASHVADHYADQRARIAELQRVVRGEAERERAARESDARAAELQRRASDLDAQRATLERATADAQRLHAASRQAASRDARVAPASAPPELPRVEAPAPSRVASELTAAVAALPPELATIVASNVAGRPERAAHAIAELGEALRAVELMARATAAGEPVEVTRGPRLVLPAGLGGLVSAVARTAGREPASPGSAAAAPGVGASRRELRVPSMAILAAPGAPGATPAASPAMALAAATAVAPAALQHVAWSDRWLARFAGARSESLEALSIASASPGARFELLAAAAPGAVFVAPDAGDDARRATASETLAPSLQAAVRIDDAAETPDDVFAAIARGRAAAPPPATRGARPASAASAPSTYDRDSLADLVAQAPPVAPGPGIAAGLASSPFAPALRHVVPMGVAPSFDVRSLFGGGLSATYLAGLLATTTDELASAAPAWAGGALAFAGTDPDEVPVRDVAGWSPTYVAPALATDAGGDAVEQAEGRARDAAAAVATITTLRSALLAWDVETQAAPSGGVETRVSAPSVTSPSLARSMLDALALPMLGETASLREPGAVDVAGGTAHASSYAAPGMIADRALGWSVANERSTADLAFDFVPPELILAARVYGLGPAEAAQAARLAIAGPGQLTAMAGAVDRTFVQALALDSERRGERARAPGAAPATSSRGPATGRAETSMVDADEAAVAPAWAAPSRAAFGVERRAPRGVFLWPSAAVASLGLQAAAPDGEQSMSVAALELLAAQGVAAMGAYAALGGTPLGRDAAGPGAEPPEGDVLAGASAMVPAARREKFHALYLALGQSTAARELSPAARAARALALAARGDEAMSTRERANLVWDVLPMVDGVRDAAPETLSTGDAATRAIRLRDELRALDPAAGDARPGLGLLSARAGEALGSYLAPSSASVASAAPRAPQAGGREPGAVLRAPTAAQELVQTGRPAGRHGGGELEIPPWFEAAARKMLEERGSMADGISLAELTLVQTAAPQQIAASQRDGGTSSAGVTPSPTVAAGAEHDKVDIERLADDVYREILTMMDMARARNGEPYL